MAWISKFNLPRSVLKSLSVLLSPLVAPLKSIFYFFFFFLPFLVASLKRGKPVCILPWKKRQRCAKAKKKHAGKSVKTEVQTSKVDCVMSSLERTKVSGIKTKGHVTRNQHSSGTKSHPAMFYSYYIAKGNALQYRKICAPKRRPCDGFFGCYDEGSIRGKKAGTGRFNCAIIGMNLT